MGLSRPLWLERRRRKQNFITPARFDSPEYWGSTEEHEIQEILQEIITNSLNASLCRKTLSRLLRYLQTESAGWVDRFSACQGTLVLKKLLFDINSSDKYMQLHEVSEFAFETMERELAIVKCFDTVFARSSVATQLAAAEKTHSVVHTLLRSALSPNQETRKIVTMTLERLKMLNGPVNVLQLLTLYRHPNGAGSNVSGNSDFEETTVEISEDRKSCASFSSIERLLDTLSTTEISSFTVLDGKMLDSYEED